MRRVFVITGLSLIGVLAGNITAQAKIIAQPDGETMEVDGATQQVAAQHPPSPSAVDHAAAPPRAQTMVPDCGGNAPGVRDVVCPAAIQACDATPDPNDIRVRIFQGPPGVTKPATNQWQFLLARCANRNQIGPGGAFPGISQAELRRLPIQPQTAIIQPPGGKTLINIPTNVYLNPTPEILNTTVIGIPVQVRVTPSSYTWTFGDGGTLTTSDPGGAHPHKTTTHTYTRTGEYSIQLITTYTGEYSLDGGNTWAGITGTAHVTSPAEAIDSPWVGLSR